MCLSMRWICSGVFPQGPWHTCRPPTTHCGGGGAGGGGRGRRKSSQATLSRAPGGRVGIQPYQPARVREIDGPQSVLRGPFTSGTITSSTGCHTVIPLHSNGRVPPPPPMSWRSTKIIIPAFSHGLDIYNYKDYVSSAFPCLLDNTLPWLGAKYKDHCSRVLLCLGDSHQIGDHYRSAMSWR